MSLKIEKTENQNEIKLEFTIEADVFEKGIKKVFTKNAKYFNIPGFRKGKAPYNIVERQYGVEVFYEDAFNEIVPEIYDNAIKENNLEVVSRPEIDIVKMEKGQELVFTAIVQTKPEVKLGKYKGIELEKIEYTVSDEDVQKEIEALAEKNARLVSVEDRTVENGDTTVIDFEGFVDGTPFEGGKAENYELKIGSKSFIEGFEDQIIGMKLEEEKEINVKFPEEYFSKELAAKDAMFKVKLHEIKTKELPEIDDELAKDLSEFETLDELKDSIRTKKEEENANKAKFELEDSAIKKVAAEVDINIPSGMIETETENMVKNFENNLYYQGINLEQYLNIINKSLEDFKKEYEPEAERTVKERLVLETIAELEKIAAEDSEIGEKLIDLAKKYGRKEEEFKDNEELKKHIAESIKMEKTIKFIVDNAKIKK